MQWLLGDFLRHLGAAPPLPALDYLKESFGHLLDLPAWAVRGPEAGEPWPEEYRPDAGGQLRGYMVTGRVVPPEFLDNLTDAAEKLFAGAPDLWATPPDRATGPLRGPTENRASCPQGLERTKPGYRRPAA